jgi:tetratricopeptide (TPR) repeat protein
MEEQFGAEAPAYAMVTVYLAESYQEAGLYTQAESILRRALSVARRAGSADQMEAGILYDLGRARLSQGAFSEGAQFLREALEIFRNAKVFHERIATRNESLATTLSELAYAAACLGHTAEAVAHAEEARDLLEQLAVPPPPRTAIKVLAVLALVYAATGRAEEAEPLVKCALSMADVASGPERRSLPTILDVYAMIELRLNRKKQAKALDKRATYIRKNASIKDYSGLTISIESLMAGLERK